MARAAAHVDLLQGRTIPPPLETLAAAGIPAWVTDASGAAWRVVADDIPPLAGHPDAAEEVPSAAQLGAASLRLHRRRAEAADRMARPRSEPLSHAAHEALREVLRDDALPAALGTAREGAGAELLHTPAVALRRATSPSGSQAGRAQRVAMTVGTLVHRLLEESPAGSVNEAAAHQRPSLSQLASMLLGHDLDACAAAVQQAEVLWKRMAGGKLGARLLELSPHVLARELPVLLPPASRAQAPGSSPAAVGFRSGAIDLVYRDPQTDQLVVADYKTDAVAGPHELRERAMVYRTQVIAYALALQEALELPAPPRAELWFLAADAIERVDVPASAAD